MVRRGVPSFFFLAILLNSSMLAPGVVAQTNDAAVQVQNLLNTYGPVPYTHLVSASVRRYVCTPPAGKPHVTDPDRMICGFTTVSVNTPRTDQVIPTGSNIRIVSVSTVQLDPLVTTELPDQLTVSSQELINCSSAPSQQSINLQVSFQKSTSASLSNSVTHTNTESLSVSAGPSWGKITGSFSLGTSDTSGTVDTSGMQMTTTRQSTATVTLTKNEAVVAEIEVWPVTYSQTFHSTVTVDADLSANDKFAHLSDMFPDPTRRTIPISGTVSITNASDGKTVEFDAPDESTTCTSGQSGVQTVPYTPATNSRLVLKH